MNAIVVQIAIKNNPKYRLSLNAKLVAIQIATHKKEAKIGLFFVISTIPLRLEVFKVPSTLFGSKLNQKEYKEHIEQPYGSKRRISILITA